MATRSLGLALCFAKRRGFAAGRPVREPQMGAAHLKVSRVGQRSDIVRLWHSSPVRLLPMATSAAERSGTTWCALGSFGGGFLGGDEVDVSVEVGPNSTLGLTTQASTKIYQAKQDGRPALQRMTASVASKALLVLSPDPLVPFAESSYGQHLRFDLAADSSAVVVDWLGAGRVAKGERWAFRDYASQLEFTWEDHHLIESLALRGTDPPASPHRFDAAVTVFAAGPLASKVKQQLQHMALQLAHRRGARIASEGCHHIVPNLTGPAVMGVSHGERCTTARLMAEKTEDIYRILHHCLKPLAEHLGVEPYADRVHGTASSLSEAPRLETSRAKVKSGKRVQPLDLDLRRSLVLCQLTDATLPVGGFAHSNGIEAASQLGLVGKELDSMEALRTLVFLGSRSMLRLQGRFVKMAYQLGKKELDPWYQLDAELQAYLTSNAVACRASGSQGAGLLRVARGWAAAEPLGGVAWPKKGHYATAFGLLAARLSLGEAATLQAFAYCTVRDSISAAVRLNLLGPLMAVDVQSSILQDLEDDLHELMAGQSAQWAPGSCCPLLDCVHSGHDLLEARLFLT